MISVKHGSVEYAQPIPGGLIQAAGLLQSGSALHLPEISGGSRIQTAGDIHRLELRKLIAKGGEHGLRQIYMGMGLSRVDSQRRREQDHAGLGRSDQLCNAVVLRYNGLKGFLVCNACLWQAEALLEYCHGPGSGVVIYSVRLRGIRVLVGQSDDAEHLLETLDWGVCQRDHPF